MWRALPRAAKVYIFALSVGGALTIAHSVYALHARPIGAGWFILAVLTLVSGSVTLKLPALPATISVSETFVFTSVLLFGPAAGTLIVVLDAFVISLWSLRHRNPLYKVIFNICALPIAIWIGSQVFFAIAQIQPLVHQRDPVSVGSLLTPLLSFTITYFLLNSSIIAIAIALERRVSAFRIWRDNFAWISLNYFGGASVAVLLVSYTREIEFSQLAIIVPLLLVSYLTFATAMGRAEDTNQHLVRLNQMYMATIETLAMAIDAKDQITHGHIRRVQTYATELARELGVGEEEQIKAIEAAALLHDMGKLGVPDYILNKPGPLSAAELVRMRRHSAIGAEILSSIQFPYPVVPIVRHHHENWDGSGYPDSLKGTEIPIGARILSVVDCFDALTSDRPYRPRLSDEAALSILKERRGSMYDPLVVDGFFRVHPRLAQADASPSETVERPGLAAITEAASSRFLLADEVIQDSSHPSSDILAFYELSHSLAAQQVPSRDVAELLGSHLKRLVRAQVYVFFLLDADGNEIFAAHAVGDDVSKVVGMRIPLGQRLSGWVAVNRGTIINSDPMLDLRELARQRTPALTASLSTALMSEHVLVGVLTLYSDTYFSQDDGRIVEVASRHIAAALKVAGESERRRLSLTDSETGLPSGEYAKKLVEAEIAATHRGGQAVSLILIDASVPTAATDPAKTAERDPPLSNLAEALRRVMRATDVLFRFHAHEFVIALPQTDFSTASRIAGRIESEAAIVGSVTREVRVGVASAPSDGGCFDDLLSVARSRVQRTSALRRNKIGPEAHI